MSSLLLLYFALVAVSLFLIGFFLIRRRLIRRLDRFDSIVRLYGDWAVVPAVLSTSRGTEDYGFDFRLEGRDWELDFKSRGGQRRGFVWTQTYYLAEQVLLRLRQGSRSFFLVIHAVGFLLLWGVVIAKTAVLPSVRDLWMLIGYDMIAAQRIGPPLVPQPVRSGARE